MRRSLAIALAAGVLLLGGCDRPHSTGSAAPPGAGQPPAADQSPAPAPTVTHPATTANPPAAAKAGTGDVDSLLNAVDKQLSSDDQPAQDQD